MWPKGKGMSVVKRSKGHFPGEGVPVRLLDQTIHIYFGEIQTSSAKSFSDKKVDNYIWRANISLTHEKGKIVPTTARRVGVRR